jgi:threonine dehydratase
MLADAPETEQLVVPIGGGGLISGIAVAAKALKPSIEIVGVEAALYPSFFNAIRGEERPIGGATLAEGIAVKTVGRQPLPIVRDLVSDIILVDEPAIERAVNAYATLQRTMAEGAGAAGLAAMLAEPERFRGKRVGLVLCGGNIDARLLASVMVRELERDDRIAAFRITSQDRPGLLGRLASRLG